MRETRGKKRGHLVTKVLLVAVSLATIIGVALIVLGITEIDSAYEGMAKKMLRASEYQMQEMFNDIYDGDWAYDEEAGGVTKGGTPVYDEYLRDMEDMSKETEINYTLFWGKTRVITTIKDKAGNYMVGTDAGEAVIDAVLNKGEQFYTTTAVIDGIPYYGYYGPVKNSDGSIVGMAFSGMPKSEVTSTITRATLIMIGVGVFLLAILIIVGVFLARSSAKAMSLITAGISTVAGGDLTHDMPGELLKRNDELGEISSNVSELIEKLREVIGTSKKLSQDVSQSGDELSESATQASAASNQVTEAVDDISKGAVGQAESVQDSAQNVNEIGGDIDTISGNVETLSGNTQDMKTACANSMAALENLLSQNTGVVNSMGVIDQQIRNTNDAVINISEATKLITDIASQTNLLALNASIEAARAGEAGKGFAVVATEIGGLAEQSRQATVEINDIVKQLIEESQKSVETIELLNQEFEEQSRQIEATKADMERMEVGVNSVADSAGEISGRVVNLDSSKGNLVSIIEDLSAVSQENAAATEETTASMEELNATFELISRSAEDLKVLASQLDEQISFFTI